MEETQIATVAEAEVPVPKSPEEQAAEERAKAQADFKRVIATKGGKAAVKAFLTTQATHFLVEAYAGKLSRKQRRMAARFSAKRLTKKVMAGEDIF